MAVTNSKSSELQPCGLCFSVSPANCDVAVHVDEKTARLAALGFSAVSRSSLNLNSCLFLGSVATSQSSSVLDVYADRYDRGQPSTANPPNNLFPESTVSLAQEDIVIPCFLNRRISKAELRQLSISTLFPSIEERGFWPSIRDIIACCISLRLSATPDTPRSSSPAVVTRADLRISLPINTVSFTPIVVPSHLFGGLTVPDLLPPVISNPGRQIFRAGYITLRSASNRLASSLGFLLDVDVWKQPNDSSLLGIWVAGTNGSPADDLRVYAACIRYAFDRQLAKCRLLPSLLVNHRTGPSLPFSSTQNTPFFLLATVNSNPRLNVSFYECRMSPALEPSFSILTATTLLPPRLASGDRFQMLKLDFLLGRAASVAVGLTGARESLDDSADDQKFDNEAADFVSATSRKPPQPQPQPNLAMPSVPDVSLWLPPPSSSENRGVTPRQITALSTPRNLNEAHMQIPISEIKAGSKSSAVSSSDFEDEWRAMRQKVEFMWQNSSQQPKLSSTMISETTTASTTENEASVPTSPPQAPRLNGVSVKSRTSDEGNVSARTLRDACVGVGTSLLMLNSLKNLEPPNKNNLDPPISKTCSCSSRGDLATQSIASKTVEQVNTTGCCIFPHRDKSVMALEGNFSIKEVAKIQKASESLVVTEKNSQYDPCSLILKWLQRCGNDTAASSTCEDVIGPDSHSRCSSTNEENVKTAATICTYLNGDLTIQKSRREEEKEEDHENKFVSLSASSSSMILKPQSHNEKGQTQPQSASESSSASNSWTNGVHASMASEKPAGHGDSFAARAREIVRQMDEWGLAPPQIRSQETSIEISVPNDISRVAGYEQIRAALENNSRFQDMSLASSSVDSGSSCGSTRKLVRAKGGNNNQCSSTDTNGSVALPRVVALESLRLGPTNTTIVMKNLASKHLPKS